MTDVSDKKTLRPGGAQERPSERPGSATPYIRSQDLFGAAQEVVIEHNEREYRLRVTAQGKLILTA